MSTQNNEIRLGFTFQYENNTDQQYKKTFTIPGVPSTGMRADRVKTRVNNYNKVMAGQSISDTAQTAYANAMKETFVYAPENWDLETDDPYHLIKIHSATLVAKVEDVIYSG